MELPVTLTGRLPSPRQELELEWLLGSTSKRRARLPVILTRRDRCQAWVTRSPMFMVRPSTVNDFNLNLKSRAATIVRHRAAAASEPNSAGSHGKSLSLAPTGWPRAESPDPGRRPTWTVNLNSDRGSGWPGVGHDSRLTTDCPHDSPSLSALRLRYCRMPLHGLPGVRQGPGRRWAWAPLVALSSERLECALQQTNLLY